MGDIKIFEADSYSGNSLVRTDIYQNFNNPGKSFAIQDLSSLQAGNSELQNEGTKKEFQCQECQYSSSIKTNLASHIKGVHKKIKDFQCQQCEYVSSHKANLNTHVKVVHNKIKDFVCMECNYAASYKVLLDKHVQKEHTS